MQVTTSYCLLAFSILPRIVTIGASGDTLEARRWEIFQYPSSDRHHWSQLVGGGELPSVSVFQYPSSDRHHWSREGG